MGAAAMVMSTKPPRLATSNLPCPEQAEALLMPADYGGGLDDERPGFPVPPSSGEPGLKEWIRWRQFRALHRALQNADLVTQRENLQLECSAAPKPARKRGDERRNHGPER